MILVIILFILKIKLVLQAEWQKFEPQLGSYYAENCINAFLLFQWLTRKFLRWTKYSGVSSSEIFVLGPQICVNSSIQSNDETVSLKLQISWRQSIKKTVKIQKRNNFEQNKFLKII